MIYRPTASFVEPLLKKYPNAKVIVTARDPDDWYRFVKNTIFQYAQETDLFPENDGNDSYLQRVIKMVSTIVLDGALANPEKFLDEEAMKAKFVAHHKWVQKHTPADKLLVMELGEGWDRICQFLDKPVPDIPYPRTNSSAAMHQYNQDFKKKLVK